MATRVFLATVLAALVVFPAGIWAAEVGTAFTYQGVLADGGVPANGEHDFRCALFDSDYGGSQVGSTFYVEDTGISEGHVTLQLDFGAVFDGTAVWLEVSVRDGASTGAYTVLTPRQELTATPYARHAAAAQHATSADTATSAGNAAQLGGENPGYYLEWVNINVPPDIADGDDDVLGGLTCGSGEVARWSGTAWICSTAEAFTRTYVVGPTGTATENGTALLAALASIPVPVSQAEAALLKIEPGLYDLGTASLEMKPWVDVEGSGRVITKLTSDVCFTDNTVAAVIVAGYSELRDLAVENTCDENTKTAVGILIDEERSSISRVDVLLEDIVQTQEGITIGERLAQLTEVKVVVVNANIYSRGIHITETGDSAVLRQVTATAYGGGGATTVGIKNSGAGAIWLDHVSAGANYGMYTFAIHSEGPWPTFQHVVAGTRNGVNMEVIYLLDPYDARLEYVETRVEGGRGISVYQTQPGSSSGRTFSFRNVDIGGEPDLGLFFYANSSDFKVVVDHCLIKGATNTLDVSGDSELVFQVGSSRLEGGPLAATGPTVTCAGVYDENYTFYPSTCP